MGFIQPCFIRKNTAELRRKLESLGYKKGDYPLPVGREDVYDRDIHLYENSYHFRDSTLYGITNNIDCGTNEELFLALAALRDDTDINQIYLWNEKHLVKCIRDCSCTLNIEATPYYMCQLIDNSDIKFEIPCKELRKATVEEIIEHFKNK